jgi:hypothetical protein
MEEFQRGVHIWRPYVVFGERRDVASARHQNFVYQKNVNKRPYILEYKPFITYPTIWA